MSFLWYCWKCHINFDPEEYNGKCPLCVALESNGEDVK